MNNEVKNQEKEKDPRLQAVEEAIEDLKLKMVDLLYNGTYTINRINRSITDNRVNWIEINIGGNQVLVNESLGGQGKVELRIDLDEMPINKTLFEAYERLSIDRDIQYYQRKVDELMAIKKKLG